MTVGLALNAPRYPEQQASSVCSCLNSGFQHTVREVMVERRYEEKTPITRRKPVPVTLSTKNPELTGQGSKRDHRGER